VRANCRRIALTILGQAGQPGGPTDFDTLLGGGGLHILVELEFESTRTWVRVRFSGVLKGPGALDAVRALVRDPRYTTGMNGLIDLRDVASLEVFGDDVRSGAELVIRLGDAFAGSRWAVLATSDPVFGIARQFELMVADPRFEVRAFRDVASAERWVGG